MRNLPARAVASANLRYLSIPFTSAGLRGITPAGCQIALARPNGEVPHDGLHLSRTNLRDPLRVTIVGAVISPAHRRCI